jgi:hypothetical protein
MEDAVSKKRMDEDAYDVSPEVQKAAVKLLDGLTKDLEAGCRSVEKGAKLSDDAKGTFRRRYRLSLQRVLSNPETAKMNHRKVLAPAMKAHGQMAAAIAGFHRSGKGSVVIDRDAFLKAAHMIEGECKAFAVRALARRRGAAAILEPEVVDDAVSSWVFCW